MPTESGTDTQKCRESLREKNHLKIVKDHGTLSEAKRYNYYTNDIKIYN